MRRVFKNESSPKSKTPCLTPTLYGQVRLSVLNIRLFKDFGEFWADVTVNESRVNFTLKKLCMDGDSRRWW
jgi:hypothetical protein